MSDAKTIRKLWGEVVDTTFRGDSAPVIAEFLRRHGDYHPIPGADAVVTQGGLEAAKTAVDEIIVRQKMDCVTAEMLVLVVLEAAKIVVMNEVVEVPVESAVAVGISELGKPVLIVNVVGGDTLYIKRADKEK